MLGKILIGRQLGDYAIVEILGQGGMAHVYKGFDKNLERYAAVKVIAPGSLPPDEELDYRERFLREARAIARLNHPNIVNVYQFNRTDDNLYYMAMKFVDGRDLRQILKEYNRQGKRLAIQHLITIIGDIADALDYAHSQGVIHRDVKPSNIMVTTDGHAVLTDFGLALSATEATLGNTFGSVHYISPEQAVSSKQASAQSDLYSLGVVVYEALTGRVPFDDDTAMSVALKHISDPPPSPRKSNPEISQQTEEILLKMLDKKPERRYQTGAEFIKTLRNALMLMDSLDTQQVSAPPSVNLAARLGAVPPQSPVNLPPTVSAGETAVTKRDTPSSHSESGIPALDDEVTTVPDLGSSSRLRRDISQVFQATIGSSSTRYQKRQTMVIMGGLVGGILVGIILLLIYTNRQTGKPQPNEDDLFALSATGSTLFDETTIAQISETAVIVVAIDSQTATAQFEGGMQEASQTAAALLVSSITDTSTEPATQTSSPTVTITSTPTAKASATLAATVPPTATASATFTLEPPTVTLTPSLEVTATPGLEAAPGEAQLLLRYDGRTLIVYNRDASSRINLSDIEFSQVTSSGRTLRFDARSWGDADLSSLRPRHCFQVWSPAYTSLAAEDFPADICTFRQGFRQTNQTFWVGESGTVFEVHDDSSLLGTCPTVIETEDDDNRCIIQLK